MFQISNFGQSLVSCELHYYSKTISTETVVVIVQTAKEYLSLRGPSISTDIEYFTVTGIQTH